MYLPAPSLCHNHPMVFQHILTLLILPGFITFLCYLQSLFMHLFSFISDNLLYVTIFTLAVVFPKCFTHRFLFQYQEEPLSPGWLHLTKHKHPSCLAEGNVGSNCFMGFSHSHEVENSLKKWGHSDLEFQNWASFFWPLNKLLFCL